MFWPVRLVATLSCIHTDVGIDTSLLQKKQKIYVLDKFRRFTFQDVSGYLPVDLFIFNNENEETKTCCDVVLCKIHSGIAQGTVALGINW